MPRGDKSSYTDKQKRQARHVEESYESPGVPEKEAESRAWATVNKETGGGNKSGSGRGSDARGFSQQERRPQGRSCFHRAFTKGAFGLRQEGRSHAADETKRSRGLDFRRRSGERGARTGRRQDTPGSHCRVLQPVLDSRLQKTKTPPESLGRGTEAAATRWTKPRPRPGSWVI